VRFIKAWINSSTEGDLLVMQFGWSLKGIAFHWYTNLASGPIDSWGHMENEFLNYLYCTCRVLNIS